MYEQTRTPLCYLHHRPPSQRYHYCDNAITYKAQRDKNARELKLANAVLPTWSAAMLLRLMQNTRRGVS